MNNELSPSTSLEALRKIIAVHNQNRATLKTFYELLQNVEAYIPEANKELVMVEKSLKALEIIKNFNTFSIEQIQGQWYLFAGVASFRNTARIPITEEQAMLLKEVLL